MQKEEPVLSNIHVDKWWLDKREAMKSKWKISETSISNIQQSIIRGNLKNNSYGSENKGNGR